MLCRPVRMDDRLKQLKPQAALADGLIAVDAVDAVDAIDAWAPAAPSVSRLAAAPSATRYLRYVRIFLLVDWPLSVVQSLGGQARPGRSQERMLTTVALCSPALDRKSA